MYEIVKKVNGYEIRRMVGTHGFYSVIIRTSKKVTEFRTFRTIKAAVAFCESL